MRDEMYAYDLIAEALRLPRIRSSVAFATDLLDLAALAAESDDGLRQSIAEARRAISRYR